VFKRVLTSPPCSKRNLPTNYFIIIFGFRIYFYKKEELLQGFEISSGSSGLEMYEVFVKML
jgi:hypothetical protein